MITGFIKKLRGGFTLVELLVVILIIGILASVLLPKWDGYLSRTRDLKRQADLRNIAVAVESYRLQKGEFPKLGLPPCRIESICKASILKNYLSPYIKEIPKDPNKENLVLVSQAYYAYKKKPLNGNDNPWNFGKEGFHLPKGEYAYQTTTDYNRVFLIAKVEIPEYANFVLTSPLADAIRDPVPGGGFHHRNDRGFRDGRMVYLCTKVDLAEKGKEVPATNKTSFCKYSSKDQLYYIIILE